MAQVSFKSIYKALALALGAVAVVYALFAIDKLRPPPLPDTKIPEKAIWLEQNWSDEERWWFHHANQGTATLPVPYEWFVALEQPYLRLFGTPPLLRNPAYLARFGFIPSPGDEDWASQQARAGYGYEDAIRPGYAAKDYAYVPAEFPGNPDGLPVGFTRLDTDDMTNPVTGWPFAGDLIGFTCAACHTGHMEVDGVSVRIDGAPAMTDLGKFRKVLGLSLLYTRYVPGRFTRFAERVLGDGYTPEKATELKVRLSALLAKGAALQKLTGPISKHDTEEGFTRLDALNRIGNQVFFTDLLQPGGSNAPLVIQNFAHMSAPVNYPQIWDASWFEWVQYDGSIMQPMVRNAGEAMGVSAVVNLIRPDGSLFRSTVQVGEVFKMEEALAGADPQSQGGFTGLLAPKWPEDLLGEIDQDKAAEGRELYKTLCQRCHLPPPSDPKYGEPSFWDDRFWTEPNYAGQRYLKFTKWTEGAEFANLVKVSYVGTDPEQAKILGDRKIVAPAYLGITTKPRCDGSNSGPLTETIFGIALASVVESVANKWYDDNNIPPERRLEMNGYRPNCIQAGPVYKARPLDGVWATAPFLHNSSVPNLYLLFSPADERPAKFYLGSRAFDPVKVGFNYDRLAGGFRMDTSKSGNANTGHEFSDTEGKGVIGPYLEPDQRYAIIEYLKTLTSAQSQTVPAGYQ